MTKKSRKRREEGGNQGPEKRARKTSGKRAIKKEKHKKGNCSSEKIAAQKTAIKNVMKAILTTLLT